MQTSIARSIGILALSSALMVAAAGCTGAGKEADTAPQSREEVLLQIDDTTLTLADVTGKIPAGLDSEDSLRLFNSIVDNWIQAQLVNEIAGQYVGDMERIDRLTEDYRRQLILAEYRRHLKKREPSDVPEDSVRSYFDTHRKELVTEAPLVKGIYLKLPDYAAADGKVLELMSRAGKKSVAGMEKTLLRDAIQYDNFTDRWVDWQTVAAQIPYRFFDPDAFLESTKDFSTSYGGATYLLHITEYLPSGSEMPYDFAGPRIRQILSRRSNADYERGIMDGLYRKALKEGRLRKIGYDPVARKMLR